MPNTNIAIWGENDGPLRRDLNKRVEKIQRLPHYGKDACKQINAVQTCEEKDYRYNRKNGEKLYSAG